jgi:hypothetical protein
MSWPNPLPQLALTAVAVLGFAMPGLASGAREPEYVPRALLRAFPLDPTGERIVTPASIRPGVLRPPVHEAAPQVAEASRAVDPLLFAIAGGGGALALGVLAAFVWLLLRSGNPRSSAREEPTAYVSAVFVGTSRLPVIEGSVRFRRRRVRAGRLALACATIVAVVLLVVHQGS